MAGHGHGSEVAHNVPILLIVDDEVDLVDVLCDALQAALPDIELVRADSAASARRLLAELVKQQRPPHLLLTDQSLGDGTGIDLIKDLRQTLPTLPALLYTGQGGPEITASAAQLGVRLLWKPLKLAGLLAEVRSALAG